LSHPILRHSPSSFLPRSATRLALPSFPTRRSSDLPLLVSDLEEQPRWAWPAWAHLRSLLVLPLMIQGEVLGVVSLHHREPGAFHPGHYRVLLILTRLAALAVTTTRLYQQTARLAVTDGLTELYNYRHFQESLTAHIREAQACGSPISLLMVD